MAVCFESHDYRLIRIEGYWTDRTSYYSLTHCGASHHKVSIMQNDGHAQVMHHAERSWTCSSHEEASPFQISEM